MIRWIFLLTISFFVSDTQAACGSCLTDSWCGCETIAPSCCSGYYWDDDIEGRNCWFSAYFKCRACTCKAGQKRSGCTCSKCPAGQYQPSGGSRATSCTECDAGQYSSRGASGCTECDAGYYQASKGGSSCGSCDAGQYSSGGASSCTGCSPGTFSVGGANGCLPCLPGWVSDGGASSCTRCVAGQYDSNNSCEGCPNGWVSSLGAISCTKCAAGKYDSSNSCKNCDAGYGTTAGASSKAGCGACPKGKSSVSGGACTACSSGKYQDQTIQSTCKLCANGRYLPVAGHDSGDDCIECPAGKVNPGGNSGTDYDSLEDCENCAAGQNQDAPGQSSCETCGAGKYAVAGSSQCYECEPGYYSETSGATSMFTCKGCPGGFFQESRGAAACKECSAGRYESDLPGGVNQQGSTGTLVIEIPTTYGCTGVCQPGTYQDQTGQSGCKDCVAGKYSTTTEESTNACQSCPTGKYSSSLAANSESTCISCPAGRYQALEGASSESDCMNCPIGKYQPASTEASCIDCDARKVTGVPNGALTCDIECLNGYEATGQIFCTKCPAGKKLDYTQSETECTQCADEIPYSDGTSCYRCLLGHYTRGCLDCPVGRYAGWESNVLDECYRCEQGYQDEEGRGNCKTCPTGRISSGDRTTCVTCPLGEYSDFENNVDCQVCADENKRHTGMIGQKNGECTQSNIYGKDGYEAGGVSFEIVELSGGNDAWATDLQRCIGECDGDWQCASGLKCFERSDGERIPGCSGNGAAPSWDYCYDPNTGGAGANQGFQAKLGDVIDNSYTAFTTDCPVNSYKNTFDGVCKDCPVGLYKNADDDTARIVGPNDFNVCKFCPVGKTHYRTSAGGFCLQCDTGWNWHPNERILKDFPHQECRYGACPMGSFARSGECVQCPVGTYWEAQAISGIPTFWEGTSGILHECRQMENQFFLTADRWSSTAAQRTLMKADCERCYENPPTLQDMGPSYCSGTTNFHGSYALLDLYIYTNGADNPGNTLEEERDACETACLGWSPSVAARLNADGDNIVITGFIIWVREGSNRGKCFCAVNTDLSRCTPYQTGSADFRTYSFDTPACRKGKQLRAATTEWAGLCRSCPTGQYQDLTGQNLCKYCPSATEVGSDTCP